MKWPWQKAEPEKKYTYGHSIFDPENHGWRTFWVHPTDWYSHSDTCQCEGTDRSRCHLHGPNGKELYDDLEESWGKKSWE